MIASSPVFSANNPIGEMLFLAGSAISVLLIFLLIFKRNDTFVVKRGFWSSLFCALGAAIAFVGNAGPPTFNWNCVTSMTVNWIGGGMLMIFHLERCFIFYCEFVVAKEHQHLARQNFGIQVSSSVVTGSLTRINDSLNTWILENRRFIRSDLISYPKLVGLSLLGVWALIGLSLIHILCPGSARFNFYDEECQKSVYTIWCVFQLRVLFAGIVGDLRRKLIRVEENLGFTDELNRQLTLAIPTIAAWIYFFPGVSERLGQSIVLIHTSIIDLLLVWSFSISFERHFPFQQSNVEVVVRTSLKEDLEALKQILRDEGQIFHDFEKFLVERFSAENAYYWIAVEKVKKLEDHEEFLRGANQVYQEFLAPTCSIPLNLSAQISEHIRSMSPEDLNSMTPQELREVWIPLLEAAQHEVLLLMVKGVYLEFRATRSMRK
eukprot:TRINITY_DN1349_c0_g5_i1.p1 TRINITY_DN1349_c0_g5~~TRINITY_DN1349_c0_g5_i1.p1  ORF type:complete len:435 (+),score=67.28 TRINITY_DN1349_c0_g5_i1:149-1453(+)